MKTHLDGVEALNRLVAKFLIIHMSESELDIFCSFLLFPAEVVVVAALAPEMTAATAD